ncbi:hypothetical protein [Aurantibacter sp.]|uniref:hypothetical protein n=1 Tax=Aurantibacter sp. TaxID=2807103 RepID=UPI003265A788
MRKNILAILCVGFIVFSSATLSAQQTEKEKKNVVSDEEEGPLMFKFEPNFLTAVESRQEEINQARAVIDTMQISDRKKRRLLRDLHKNPKDLVLSKTTVAETKFEDN